jgi:hypothetical protein
VKVRWKRLQLAKRETETLRRLRHIFLYLLIVGALLPVVGAVLRQGLLAEDSLAPTEAQPTSGDEQSGGLDQKDRLKKRQQEFLREHTDESGSVRPDLWQQGIEQTKKMKIAPSISTPLPTSSKNPIKSAILATCHIIDLPLLFRDVGNGVQYKSDRANIPKEIGEGGSCPLKDR